MRACDLVVGLRRVSAGQRRRRPHPRLARARSAWRRNKDLVRKAHRAGPLALRGIKARELGIRIERVASLLDVPVAKLERRTLIGKTMKPKSATYAPPKKGGTSSPTASATSSRHSAHPEPPRFYDFTPAASPAE